VSQAAFGRAKRLISRRPRLRCGHPVELVVGLEEHGRCPANAVDAYVETLVSPATASRHDGPSTLGISTL